jgi:hypothetical protein
MTTNGLEGLNSVCVLVMMNTGLNVPIVMVLYRARPAYRCYKGIQRILFSILGSGNGRDHDWFYLN